MRIVAKQHTLYAVEVSDGTCAVVNLGTKRVDNLVRVEKVMSDPLWGPVEEQDPYVPEALSIAQSVEGQEVAPEPKAGPVKQPAPPPPAAAPVEKPAAAPKAAPKKARKT